MWKILHMQITCMQKGEYHDLDLQSNTLLLADVSESFREMCLKIYHLNKIYVKFLSTPGLT